MKQKKHHEPSTGQGLGAPAQREIRDKLQQVTVLLQAQRLAQALGAALRFKWERHGEFSGYTFFAPGADQGPFESTALGAIPAAWLGAMPGRTSN